MRGWDPHHDFQFPKLEVGSPPFCLVKCGVYHFRRKVDFNKSEVAGVDFGNILFAAWIHSSCSLRRWRGSSARDERRPLRRCGAVSASARCGGPPTPRCPSFERTFPDSGFRRPVAGSGKPQVRLEASRRVAWTREGCFLLGCVAQVLRGSDGSSFAPCPVCQEMVLLSALTSDHLDSPDCRASHSGVAGRVQGFAGDSVAGHSAPAAGPLQGEGDAVGGGGGREGWRAEGAQRSPPTALKTHREHAAASDSLKRDREGEVPRGHSANIDVPRGSKGSSLRDGAREGRALGGLFQPRGEEQDGEEGAALDETLDLADRSFPVHQVREVSPPPSVGPRTRHCTLPQSKKSKPSADFAHSFRPGSLFKFLPPRVA